MSEAWRVGRSLGRTLYIQNGGDPKDDTFVGVMDTRELAERVVAAVNGLADLRAKVEALPERGISMTWDHPEGLAMVRRGEVLALLDGSSDA